LTSSDGLHWVASAHTLKLSSVMETLPFGGGLVVTHDDSGGDVTAFDTGFSTDFATGWRQGPELFSTGFTPFFGAVYASQSDLDGNGHVAVTTDGATWRDVADTHDFSTALAASETTLVAATSCDILTTKDGTTWAHRDAP
ncbi:MAG TPA: hypothetical protein VHB21_21260, partial [Minicystis sp.]|nr:hypothetical protein [Minicystis sp.]